MTRPLLTNTIATMLEAAKPKRNKYNARKVECLGFKFDSIAERDRYLLLLDWQKRGQIHSLEVHPKYVLTSNGQKVATYTADFRYYEVDGGDCRQVVEDVKSPPTAASPVFRRNLKHMRAEHGVIVDVILNKPARANPKREA